MVYEPDGNVYASTNSTLQYAQKDNAWYACFLPSSDFLHSQEPRSTHLLAVGKSRLSNFFSESVVAREAIFGCREETNCLRIENSSPKRPFLSAAPMDTDVESLSSRTTSDTVEDMCMETTYLEEDFKSSCPSQTTQPCPGIKIKPEGGGDTRYPRDDIFAARFTKTPSGRFFLCFQILREFARQASDA